MNNEESSKVGNDPENKNENNNEDYIIDGENTNNEESSKVGYDPEKYEMATEKGNDKNVASSNVRGGRQSWQSWRVVDQCDWETAYFRESPLMNSHHYHWHLFGGGGTRRSEMFAFMHGQMMNRYNSERLSYNQSESLALWPDQWWTHICGYQSEIDGFPDRMAGPAISMDPEVQRYLREHQRIIGISDSLRHNGYNHRTGQDRGIAYLARQVELRLHAWGHFALARYTGTTGWSIMTSPTVSARDPSFYQWHGYIEQIFQRYKASLGPYYDSDLSFPGVTVEEATIVSPGFPNNTFNTFFEQA